MIHDKNKFSCECLLNFVEQFARWLGVIFSHTEWKMEYSYSKLAWADQNSVIINLNKIRKRYEKAHCIKGLQTALGSSKSSTSLINNIVKIKTLIFLLECAVRNRERLPSKIIYIRSKHDKILKFSGKINWKYGCSHFRENLCFQ